MRSYETIFITLPTLTDDEEKTVVDHFAQVVADSGGSLAIRDRMGRRRLAYPISKHEDGVYTRFIYDADPAVPKELDRRLRISDKVLRHMTIFMEPEWAVFSKEQYERDLVARAEAEAARAAGIVPPEPAGDLDDERVRGRRDDAGDEGDDEEYGR